MDEPLSQLHNEPQEEKEMTELEVLKKERDEYLEGWKRAKADFTNYKKEETERTRAMGRILQEGIIRDCITILDSFNLGLQTLKEDDPAHKGMILIKNQLEDMLKKYGLKAIPFAQGMPFDPNIHEAVSEIHSEDPPGTIIKEIERGYMLGEKVMRPARVVLSKEQGQ